MRDLAVQDVQVSIYSHRPEVHDAITMLPGSLKRTVAGIKLLRAHGVKVIIANVLMMQNLGDHARGEGSWRRSWAPSTPSIRRSRP